MAAASVSTRRGSFLSCLASTWFSYLIIILFLMSCNGLEAGSDLLLPQRSPQCACANEVLMFTCTIVGGEGGITQWSGTAFDCPNFNNEILLSHESFRNPNGANKSCNGGQITGRSLRVENTCYISQLSVTTSTALNNKTICCIHNNEGGQVVPIGTTVLTIISAGFNEPPGNVVLRDIQSGILVFSWSRVDPTNCALETYNITYNGCGICRVGSNYSATCTDIQASVTPTQCNLSVYSVVCGFPGTPSNSTVVNLMVPDNTSIQAVLPIYASDTQLLIKVAVTITFLTPFYFTSDISSNITHFNFTFSSSDRTISVNKSVDNSTEYRAEVPKSICSSTSVDVNVAIAAANRLGQGPPSQPNLFGCTNQFVKVEYDQDMSTFTCVFLNTGSQNSNIRMSCSIHYGACRQEFNQNAQGNTTVESPDRVTIRNIKLGGSDCYAVRASNDTYTVIVEGTFNTGPGSQSNTAAIAAGVVSSLLLACFVVILIVAIYIMLYVKRKRSVPLNNKQFESVNQTFSVKESIDFPNRPNEEPIIEDEDDHEIIPGPVPEPQITSLSLDVFSGY